MKMTKEIYNKLKNLGLTVESFEKTKENTQAAIART